MCESASPRASPRARRVLRALRGIRSALRAPRAFPRTARSASPRPPRRSTARALCVRLSHTRSRAHALAHLPRSRGSDAHARRESARNPGGQLACLRRLVKTRNEDVPVGARGRPRGGPPARVATRRSDRALRARRGVRRTSARSRVARVGGRRAPRKRRTSSRAPPSSEIHPLGSRLAGAIARSCSRRGARRTSARSRVGSASAANPSTSPDSSFSVLFESSDRASGVPSTLDRDERSARLAARAAARRVVISSPLGADATRTHVWSVEPRACPARIGGRAAGARCAHTPHVMTRLT